MGKFASLMVKEEINPLTGMPYVVSVEWVGHHSLRLKIHIDCLRDERLLKLLPFDLEKCPMISDDDEYALLIGGYQYYIRKDRHYWLAYHRFMNDWARILKVWQLLKGRIILTLIVWGIGWADQSQIIDWYCLGQKRPWDSR
jgi:hypothetical protein